jgi:SAM-dependent methyltransferase
MVPMSSTEVSTDARCPGCGRPGLYPTALVVEREYRLMKCRVCGLGALDVPPGEDGGDHGFDEYWDDVNRRVYGDPRVVAELRAKYLRYYERLVAQAPNRRFLDVGSGAGISVDAARRAGFEARGVEPSPSAVSLSRERYGIPVAEGLLTGDDDLPRDFGVLSLWDVVEHTADPEGLLRACAAHLVPGGIFLLETPDEGALLRGLIRTAGRLGGRADAPPSIYYRAHRFYFTRAAMQRMLERAGFVEVEFRAERTMYEKELLKKRLYGGMTAGRERRLRAVFGVLRRAPLLANKMVVVARKRGE